MSEPYTPRDSPPVKGWGGSRCGLSHCKGTLEPHLERFCPWPCVSPILCIKDVTIGDPSTEVLLRTSRISWVRQNKTVVSFVVDGKEDEVLLGSEEEALRVYAEIKTAMFNLPE